MFPAAHRSSSGALKCDRPLPRLSGHCSAHLALATAGHSLELLMMSGVPLETCWAFKILWNNKFYYKAASCWYFYWAVLTVCSEPSRQERQKSDLAPNNSFVPFLQQRVTIVLFRYQLRQSFHVLILLHVNVMCIHSVGSDFCLSVWT